MLFCLFFFFFSSRRRHTRLVSDWSSDVCSSDLSPEPTLDLYDTRWVIHTQSQERPPVKIGLQGQIIQSLVANGCTIRGRVEHSVLSPGVYVSPEALVRDSIVLNDSWIGPGAILDHVIVDKDVVIGANT